MTSTPLNKDYVNYPNKSIKTMEAKNGQNEKSKTMEAKNGQIEKSKIMEVNNGQNKEKNKDNSKTGESPSC